MLNKKLYQTIYELSVLPRRCAPFYGKTVSL